MRSFTAPTSTVSLLLLALCTQTTSAQADAKPYTDTATGIKFLGFSDGTGYQFGMALPTSPKSDAIMQLISPIKGTSGWGGIDLGDTMTKHLIIATWANDKKVMLSPRIATGYEVDTGANPYTKNKIELQPISKGTFVNSSHVAATFVCGGCLNADSFTAADSKATFGYAYTKQAVGEPSDVDTRLSDHTALGEPYGAFGLSLKAAMSDKYPTWAALVGGGDGGKKGSGSGGSNCTNSTASSSSEGSSTGGSANSQHSELKHNAAQDLLSNRSAGYWFLMTAVIAFYAMQAFIH